MTTCMPNGELLRRAVKWIAEERKCGETNISKLVEAASVQFNLGPLDQENLMRLLKEEKNEGESPA